MRAPCVGSWLVLASVCALTACSGGGQPAEETPVAAAETAPAAAPEPAAPAVSAPARAPAPPPAPAPAPAVALPGGDSPQDVAARVAAAGRAKDVAALVNLIAPSERKGLSAMMALLPAMLGMAKPFLQMGWQQEAAMAGDDEQTATEKAEKRLEALDGVLTEMSALTEKHKIALPSMEEMGINPMAMAGGPDLSDLATKVGDRLDGADLGAFLAEALKVGEKLGKVMSGGEGGGGMFGDFGVGDAAGELADLTIDGDAASGTLDGKPAWFVCVDGRWYLRLGPPRAAPDEGVPDMGPDPGDEGEDKDDEGGGEDDGGGR